MNVAVPPPQEEAAASRGRSHSGAAMSSRLRAASEMQAQGKISTDEKAAIKQLMLHSDPGFREQFDRARQSGDLSAIKKLLKSNLASEASSMLDELTEMSLGDVEDFSSLLDDIVPPPTVAAPSTVAMPPPAAAADAAVYGRQSVGFGSAFGDLGVEDVITRKRQASRSMPSQGMQKVSGRAAAPPEGAAQTRGRTDSAARRPGDVHRAAAMQGSQRPPMAQMQQQHQHQQAPPPPPQRQSHPQQSQFGPGKIKQEPFSLGSVAAGAGGAGAVAGPGTAAAAAAAAAARAASSSERLHKAATDAARAALEMDDAVGDTKARKNERERKRRLAVTQGFDELYKLLKDLEEKRQAAGKALASTGAAGGKGSASIVATSKLDKASILRSCINKIQHMENDAHYLRQENDRIRALLQSK